MSRVVKAEPAMQLAALRVVVPAMILICPEVRNASELARVPSALRVVPEGLGWFAALVPIHPTLATVAQLVCVFSGLCALFGLWTRASLIALTLSSFYVFSLSQLAGAVWHDMHLLWMVALLAVSPCDEALCFDRRGEAPRLDSVRYGWPLFFARLLLACVYFFPGFHKLHTSGLAWALSDNLRNQLWWKWAEHGAHEPFRVDLLPGFLQGGGLFVLAFELSFPVLALVPRTRPWVAGAGLVFHLMAGVLFRIPFVSLWALYAVLLNPTRIVNAVGRTVGRVLRREPVAARGAGVAHEAALMPFIVGALLVLGAFVQGARGQMRAYPFACYPTFEWMVGTEMPDLVVEIESTDGHRAVLPHARNARGYRTQRQWGEIWSLAGVTGTIDERRLRAYFTQSARTEAGRTLVAHAARVRFYRAYVSVVPEERDAPSRRGPLLAEITP